MSSMLTQVHEGRLCRVRVWASGVATLPRRTASILQRRPAAGSEADITIIDLDREGDDRGRIASSRAARTRRSRHESHRYAIHTLGLRGRFVMKDRHDGRESNRWGRSVRRIQRMPPHSPRTVIRPGGP